MNFELGYVGRIVLFLVLLFGGCYSEWASPAHFIESARRAELYAAGMRKLADMRAHEWEPRYCQQHYPGASTWAWEFCLTDWQRAHFGAPDAGERISIWKAAVNLMFRWPEDVEKHELRWRASSQLSHVPFQYGSQADLVDKLRALRAKKFADVRASVKGSE